MGQWMSVYAPTVQGVRGGIVPPQDWGVTTQRDKTLYVHVTEPGHTAILLPSLTLKPKSVCEYESRCKVDYTLTPQGLVLALPLREEGAPDQVIELTFKETLQ